MVFSIGILFGLAIAGYSLRSSVGSRPNPAVPLVRQHQILCQTTPAGTGYVYSANVASIPYCSNDATPHALN